MKTIICLLLVLSPVWVFGAAPESLAGKVYREYQLFSGVTNASESTVVLGTNGRYVALKSAFGVVGTRTTAPATGLPEAHWGAVNDPSSDGSYQYEKTGDTTGVLTLVSDTNANPSRTTLLFDSPTTGSTSPHGLSGLGGQMFYLTDLPADSSTALPNVSMRGNVTAGKPLIMGFVIPRTMEREVLIRVIGPSLASFGVSGAWSNSSLQIYKNGSAIFGASFRFPFWSDIPPAGLFPGVPLPAGLFPNLSNNPEAGLRKIFNYLGAFSLPSGSKDSAVVIRLSPGDYTIMASATSGDPGGEALIELYPLP